MSPNEVAEYIGVSRATVERLRRDDDKFPTGRKLGERMIRFDRGAIDAYMQGGVRSERSEQAAGHSVAS